MAKVGIFYGSTEGNTEDVAYKIQKLIGDAEVINVDAATADDLSGYEAIIFGASTWEIGELQEDWEGFIDELDGADLSGKTVALFGLGDNQGYPDTFVDAIGIIYDKIKGSGANFVGAVEVDGYEFDESKAVVDGKFIGLPLDEDNEPDMTDERVEKWVASLGL